MGIIFSTPENYRLFDMVQGLKYERDAIEEPSIFLYDADTGAETLRVTRNTADNNFKVSIFIGNGTDVTWRDDNTDVFAVYIRTCLAGNGVYIAATNFGMYDFIVEGRVLSRGINEYLHAALTFAKSIQSKAPHLYRKLESV